MSVIRTTRGSPCCLTVIVGVTNWTNIAVGLVGTTVVADAVDGFGTIAIEEIIAVDFGCVADVVNTIPQLL